MTDTLPNMRGGFCKVDSCAKCEIAVDVMQASASAVAHYFNDELNQDDR